jgi:hypothetical protein
VYGSHTAQIPVPGRCVNAGTLATNLALTQKDQCLILSKRRRPISKHINDLWMNKNVDTSPEGARNQERLCCRVPQQQSTAMLCNTHIPRGAWEEGEADILLPYTRPFLRAIYSTYYRFYHRQALLREYVCIVCFPNTNQTPLPGDYLL